MSHQILLLLAMLTLGLAISQRREQVPCRTVNKEALCHGLGLLQVPSVLSLDIQALYLSGNQLQSILVSPLGFYTALRHLDLSDNQISFLQAGVFQALPYLEHLNLAHNRLATGMALNSGGLGRLPLLVSLDLSGNSLHGNLVERLLGETPRLRTLSLAENSLTRLARHTFWGMPAVEQLDLHSNVLMDIEDGAFEALPHLTHLNLSRNCLRSFEARQVDSLPCLVLLDLSHNVLEALELGTKVLGSLQTLVLQDNALQELPPYTFASLASLQRLNLQGNQVSPCGGPAEPGPPGCVDFSGIPTLHVLNMAGNSMGMLRAGSFLHTPLTELDLSTNPGLDVATGALVGLEASLEVLELQGNGLTVLRVDLPCFLRLKRLNLAENQLSHLPAWTRAVSLEVLDLRNNSFSLLPGNAMGGLETSLRRLYLQGNPLSCCGNGWLAAQLHQGRVDVDATQDLICRFGSQEELSLSLVRPEDCEKGGLKNVNLILLLSFTLVSAIVLTTLATICFLRRQKLSQQYKA